MGHSGHWVELGNLQSLETRRRGKGSADKGISCGGDQRVSAFEESVQDNNKRGDLVCVVILFQDSQGIIGKQFLRGGRGGGGGGSSALEISLPSVCNVKEKKQERGAEVPDKRCEQGPVDVMNRYKLY